MSRQFHNGLALVFVGLGGENPRASTGLESCLSERGMFLYVAAGMMLAELRERSFEVSFIRRCLREMGD